MQCRVGTWNEIPIWITDDQGDQTESKNALVTLVMKNIYPGLTFVETHVIITTVSTYNQSACV